MNKQYRVVMHRAADKGGESFRQLIDPLEAEVAPCASLVKSCYSPNWMLRLHAHVRHCPRVKPLEVQTALEEAFALPRGRAAQIRSEHQRQSFIPSKPRRRTHRQTERPPRRRCCQRLSQLPPQSPRGSKNSLTVPDRAQANLSKPTQAGFLTDDCTSMELVRGQPTARKGGSRWRAGLKRLSGLIGLHHRRRPRPPARP